MVNFLNFGTLSESFHAIHKPTSGSWLSWPGLSGPGLSGPGLSGPGLSGPWLR